MKSIFFTIILLSILTGTANAQRYGFTATIILQQDSVDQRLNVSIQTSDTVKEVRVRDVTGKTIADFQQPHGSTECSLSIPLNQFLNHRTYFVEAVSEVGYVARKFNFE